MCSTKIGNANNLSLGTNSYNKKGTWPLGTALFKQCNFDSGWLEQQQGSLHSFFWILWTQEIWSVLEQSWKKVYSRTTTKSIPLLQPEHGFCQHEKMVVVPVCLNGRCLNGRCCLSGCVGNVLTKINKWTKN